MPMIAYVENCAHSSQATLLGCLQINYVNFFHTFSNYADKIPNMISIGPGLQFEIYLKSSNLMIVSSKYT